MRLTLLGLAVLLGACGSVDTSPGSSGVPDMPFGQPGFERGFQSTTGGLTLNRELTPNDPRRFDLPPSNNPRAFNAPPPGDPRRLGW
ncbi:hypothetical protein [Sediminicoccus sp. KRV36]|uniref:hypothetical protein n=1 Tax=Sediminicoccus sp. KRV36 TaxID=3133721 RepID=UPI00200C7F5C|nr:hypothetical protein [Sediminicoccus rosea]UPY36885.1 hypothetical protein LHU95_22140 [Sediminicoccus rosea]